MGPDYSQYNYIELEESLESIDKDKHPEIYKRLIEAMDSYDQAKKVDEVIKHEILTAKNAAIFSAIIMPLYALIKLYELYEKGFFE